MSPRKRNESHFLLTWPLKSLLYHFFSIVSRLPYSSRPLDLGHQGWNPSTSYPNPRSTSVWNWEGVWRGGGVYLYQWRAGLPHSSGIVALFSKIQSNENKEVKQTRLKQRTKQNQKKNKVGKTNYYWRRQKKKQNKNGWRLILHLTTFRCFSLKNNL